MPWPVDRRQSTDHGQRTCRRIRRQEERWDNQVRRDLAVPGGSDRNDADSPRQRPTSVSSAQCGTEPLLSAFSLETEDVTDRCIWYLGDSRWLTAERRVAALLVEVEDSGARRKARRKSSTGIGSGGLVIMGASHKPIDQISELSVRAIGGVRFADADRGVLLYSSVGAPRGVRRGRTNECDASSLVF